MRFQDAKAALRQSSAAQTRAHRIAILCDVGIMLAELTAITAFCALIIRLAP
jgi:hypothetical protein